MHKLSDLKRSLWKERGLNDYRFFCPLCKAPKRLSYHPRFGAGRQLLQIFLTAFVVALLTWNFLKWKGIVWIVPIWGGYEFIFRSKKRIDLKCVECGFDPYLFLLDEQSAKKEIQSHWEKKRPTSLKTQAKST